MATTLKIRARRAFPGSFLKGNEINGDWNVITKSLHVPSSHRLCDFSRNHFALATLFSLVTFCLIDNDNKRIVRCHYRWVHLLRVGDLTSL